jgi:hypothetical protein
MKLLSILRALHCEGHCHDIPNLFLNPILVNAEQDIPVPSALQLSGPDVKVFIAVLVSSSEPYVSPSCLGSVYSSFGCPRREIHVPYASTKAV